MPEIVIAPGGGPPGVAGPSGSALVGSAFYRTYTGAPAVTTLWACPAIPANSFSVGDMIYGIFSGTFTSADPKQFYVNFYTADNPGASNFLNFSPAASHRFFTLEFWIVRQDASNIWIWGRLMGFDINTGGNILQTYARSVLPGFAKSDPLYLWLRGSGPVDNCIQVYALQVYKT